MVCNNEQQQNIFIRWHVAAVDADAEALTVQIAGIIYELTNDDSGV